MSSFSMSILAQEHHADSVRKEQGAANIKKEVRSDKHNVDSLLLKKKKADSVLHRINSNINKINEFKLSSLPDRLHRKDTLKSKADSTAQKDKVANAKTDSLPKREKPLDSLSYKKKKVDGMAHRVNSKIDSINDFKLSSLLRRPQHLEDTTKVKSDTTQRQEAKRKSVNGDSLKQHFDESLKSVKNAPDSIQQKVNAQLTTAQKKIDAKTGFLDSLHMNLKDPVTGKSANYGIEGINTTLPAKSVNTKDLPSSDLQLPSARSPDVKLDEQLKMPDNNPLDKINKEVADRKQQSQKQLQNNELLKDASKLKEQAAKVGEVTKKAEAYQKDIENIKEGGLEKAEALPEEAEKAAANLGGVKELKAETQKFETTKNVLQQYQDAVKEMNDKKLLEEGKDLGQKQLADHFAGKEDKLKAGAAQLDKLKKKYGNIPDSRYLPKRAPNPLNGKPLIERLIPGINLQVFEQRNLANIDVSPFIMYKISPRWRVGTGGTYRLQFNKKVQWIDENPAYGGRIMTNILIWGGIHLHLEGEEMRSVPYDFYSQSFNMEEGKKWMPGLHAGILKHYKISKKVNGNFQVLYNFLYHRNGLYPNKVNMRFGFEFPIKKKTKKTRQ